MTRFLASLCLVVIALAFSGCAGAPATPTTTLSNFATIASHGPNPAAFVPTQTQPSVPSAETSTPFPQPRIFATDDWGIAAEYGFHALDLNVSASKEAFAWTWSDWSPSRGTSVYPGLMFLPSINLTRPRHLVANQPIVVGVESKQERVVTGSVDGAVEVWNARTGLRDFVFGAVPGKPTSIALNGDDTLVAVGANGRYQGGDGSVTVWKKDDPNPIAVLPAYGVVTRVSFAPNSNVLYFSTNASSCARGGGGIFMWDGQSRDAVQVFSAEGNSVVDFAVHPGGKLIATAGQIGSARCTTTSVASVWDATNGKRMQVITPMNPFGTAPEQTADAHSVAFSPDGELLAVGDVTGRVQLWDWSKPVITGTASFDSEPTTRIFFLTNGLVLYLNQDDYIRLLEPR